MNRAQRRRARKKFERQNAFKAVAVRADGMHYTKPTDKATTVIWKVGETCGLPKDQDLVLCAWALHFSLHPIGCLYYMAPDATVDKIMPDDPKVRVHHATVPKGVQILRPSGLDDEFRKAYPAVAMKRGARKLRLGLPVQGIYSSYHDGRNISFCSFKDGLLHSESWPIDENWVMPSLVEGEWSRFYVQGSLVFSAKFIAGAHLDFDLKCRRPRFRNVIRDGIPMVLMRPWHYGHLELKVEGFSSFCFLRFSALLYESYPTVFHSAQRKEIIDSWIERHGMKNLRLDDPDWFRRKALNNMSLPLGSLPREHVEFLLFTDPPDVRPNWFEISRTTDINVKE